MIYRNIAEQLRIRLNYMDSALNSLLPDEKKLMEEFAVSQMTIRKVIDLLVAWGLVVRRHGSGTYLMRKDMLHQIASLTGPVEVLEQQGKTVINQVLILGIMPAPPAIANRLRIQVDEQIYFSRRARFVRGGPLTLEDSYMPVKLFRDLSLQHLEGPKFECIGQGCGTLIGGNYESLMSVLADRLLARRIKVVGHTSLLRITSLSYSENGEFLDYSVMFRNASEYQVEYRLRRPHPEKSQPMLQKNTVNN